MKLRNRKLRYNLQFFADKGDAGQDDTDNSGDDGDADQEENSGDNSEEEKTFTQADIDKTVEKRLARERRKWEREKNKKDGNSEDKAGDDKDKGVDKDILAKAEKAEILETKLLCYEQGVDKDSVDDVVALAKAYVNDDADIEDAIEKVLKKYPQFKASAKNEDEETDNQKGSWGERQKGSGKKLSGVEAAFLKNNPDLKID